VKCARCGHDSTYPQRSARLCPECKKPFAFEPRDGDPVSDMAWKNAIDAVSSGGTVRYVAANLHHEVARRQPRSGAGAVATVVAGIGSVVGVATLGVGALPFGIAGTALVGLAAWRARRGLRLERHVFTSLLARWTEVHGAPAGLYVPPKREPLRSAELDSELESYSFDRAVICDRADIVDLLLANDFHFENNCAVLSSDGHPRHAFAIVRKMLRSNPRLEVYVLHDATPNGCTLAHYLRHDPDWFGGTPVRVFDVALRPPQGKRMLRSAWRVDAPVEAHPALSPADRTWLASWRVELAAIRPEQLIKRLFRSMQLLSTAAASDDVITWTTDAGVSDGGGDSFG
jgi:hypothetical protein